MPKIRNKKLKKLQDHHDYLNRKTRQLDDERGDGERSADSKQLLVRLKKQKLAIKDAINQLKATLTKM